MENAVIINAQLPSAQAEALLESLKANYRQSFNEHWYADQFRLVADGNRHKAILAHVPVMAAQKHLIGALAQGLNKAVKKS